jgi:hypothetical protein
LPTRQGEFRIKFHRSVALDQGDQGPMLWFFKYFRRKI